MRNACDREPPGGDHRRENLPGLIGRHPLILDVCRNVRAMAPKPLPVIIQGETGSGKEVVARAIHDLDHTRSGPFVAVNCANLSGTLADGELFGWERGAFTGAFQSQAGHLEEAHRGTLFLDEASSLPSAVQAKLLRVLERQVVHRLCGRQARACEFRLILALQSLGAITDGTFRVDFRHRVDGFRISLPPLRDRRSDIPLLARHFLDSSAMRDPRDPPLELDGGALRLLDRYGWPGNVRELKMMMDRLVALAEIGVITAVDVARQLPRERADSVDDEGLAEIVARCGSISGAARALGISRSTLRRRLSAAGMRSETTRVAAARPSAGHAQVLRIGAAAQVQLP